MKTKFQCRLTSAFTTLSAAAGTNVKARTLQLGMIATALLALSAVATPARADDARSEWRRDSREIRQDRALAHQGHQGQAASWQGSRR